MSSNWDIEMQNQTTLGESDRCDHPNNEPIIYRSSNFDVYNGVMHRIPAETPSIIQSSNFDVYDGMTHRIPAETPYIIQSSTSHVWYTNNGGAITMDVSRIRSKN
ncbi:hypothetical protein LBA_01002 [Megavirus lba]|uniref:Uncharacterized protein n=1 Tax=Megavirus lba TaxID=1235314 RepID=L7XZQ1_9VIRU|nr:hypothetical protein LBA_01002 [Megavirus lba]